MESDLSSILGQCLDGFQNSQKSQHISKNQSYDIQCDKQENEQYNIDGLLNAMGSQSANNEDITSKLEAFIQYEEYDTDALMEDLETEHESNVAVLFTNYKIITNNQTLNSITNDTSHIRHTTSLYEFCVKYRQYELFTNCMCLQRVYQVLHQYEMIKRAQSFELMKVYQVIGAGCNNVNL